VNLFMRSLVVLVLLFGLVFAVGAAVLYRIGVSVGWAIAFAAFVVSLQYILAPWLLDLIYNIQWTGPDAISADFSDYLNTLCSRRGIPVPQFGIIEDGNPNAFTYGHYPSDARLVVTRGLREMLTEEEFKAVVAHEVGHIRHYDFVVMTIASLASAVLYILYKWSRFDSRGAATGVLAVGAYVAYVVSQFVVLALSRIREYYADQHASYSVDDPNAIATALIKIGYGLARTPQVQPGQQPAPVAASTPAGGSAPAATPFSAAGVDDDPFSLLLGLRSSSSQHVLTDFSVDGIRELLARPAAVTRSQCLGALGICSFNSAATLALYSTTPAGQFSLQKMLAAMQWDLWNPWARWFELTSTHPLIARRVMVAMDVARRLGHTPLVPPCAPPAQSLLAPFVFDVVVGLLPLIGLTAGLLAGLASLPLLATRADTNVLSYLWCLRAVPLLFGVGWLMRLLLSYSYRYQPATVSDLVGRVDVSPIRHVAVEIEGVVIGRGVPGIAWSKDLILQDLTGFIPLIYSQPLGILETIFGFFFAASLIGRRVRIRGWYRRGPAPYIELNNATTEYGGRIRCYDLAFTYVAAILTAAAGIALMFVKP